MVMRKTPRACLAAGAFGWILSAPAVLGEGIRIAAARPGGECPAGGVIPGIAPLVSGPAPADPTHCILLVRLEGLSDAEIDAAVGSLASVRSAAGAVLTMPAVADEARFAYAVKRLSSIFHAGSPEGRLALDPPEALEPTLAEDLAPYFDALLVRPERPAPAAPAHPLWVLAERSESATAVAAVLGAIAAFPRAELYGLSGGVAAGPADVAALERLERFLKGDVSPDPTATRVTRTDGSAAPVLRFFDAKAFTPILFLPRDPAGRVRVELSGGPFARASVQNLASGASRDFELHGAGVLDLDLSSGSLAVVLKPAERSGGETRAAVEVGATRGLTAQEIVARERVWDAGQREKLGSYIATMDSAMRYRVAELQQTIDLTIIGPYFFKRGEAPDWAWQEFYLNGVKWKGRTIPKLPLLQPDKVTTLPLDIRLTEDYDYELAGVSRIDGRMAYRVDFRPRASVGDKPVYRGTAWIDRETFALLRRESIQMNLKGDTLSNIQTEYYREVPGAPGVVLPLEIRGEQVFSTAGRVTAVERAVTMTNLVVNPPDFQTRLQEAYASKSQMVRDTDRGFRYLVPNPEMPGERLAEEKFSRKSLFGLVGAFYQRSNDYPLPLVGVQYFNFNMWEKNKQLSVFFGGALLFANYTDPSLFGSHFDLGADVFAVAFPFKEQFYRNGQEIKAETIKHLPEFFQVNVGHPLGPYLKASVGIFTQWDNYQRDKDTGPNFVTPVDTLTNGAEGRLVWNQDGYNLALQGAYYSRVKWEAWGDPATSGYEPGQKNYWKYSAELSKGFYFANFKKLLVKVSYLDGSNLDRFSEWDFGPFGEAPLRGFPTGSVRANRAYVANISYGLNIQNIIRFEILYDQAIVTENLSQYHNTYFSGVGLQAAVNGPWDNTRIRAEIGYPVVAHGVKGLTLNAQLLKLF
jgi:hypothetical protein